MKRRFVSHPLRGQTAHNRKPLNLQLFLKRLDGTRRIDAGARFISDSLQFTTGKRFFVRTRKNSKTTVPVRTNRCLKRLSYQTLTVYADRCFQKSSWVSKMTHSHSNTNPSKRSRAVSGTSVQGSTFLVFADHRRTRSEIRKENLGRSSWGCGGLGAGVQGRRPGTPRTPRSAATTGTGGKLPERRFGAFGETLKQGVHARVREA